MNSTNVPSTFLAKLFDISTRRIQQLAKDGVIPKADDGKYHLLGSVKGYVKSLQEALRHGGGENGDMARVRYRYEVARAEEKELEVAKMLGDVVMAEDVQAAWDNAASNWKAKLLALPSKIAVQTATLNDRHEIEEVVTAMVESTLTEIALYGNTTKNTQQKKAKASAKGGGRKPKTTAKTKRKPVGG